MGTSSQSTDPRLTIAQDAAQSVVAIAEGIGLDDDLSPQTRLIGKRPPSIAGVTPSMTTRLRPSSSSIVHTPSGGDDMMGAFGMP